MRDRFRAARHRRPHPNFKCSVDTIDRPALSVQDVFFTNHLTTTAENARVKRLRKIVKRAGLSSTAYEFFCRAVREESEGMREPSLVVIATASGRYCGGLISLVSPLGEMTHHRMTISIVEEVDRFSVRCPTNFLSDVCVPCGAIEIFTRAPAAPLE